MKKLLLCVVVLALAIGLCACNGEKKNEQPEGDSIKINEIETLASAKILANSEVIEKDKLPEKLQYIVDLGEHEGVRNTMISGVYTKSDYSKEEYDILHDYSFLFGDDDQKSIKVNLSLTGTPLRDYFFESTDEISSIEGIEITLYNFRDRYLARFSNNEVNFGVESQGISEEDFISFIKSLI